jgi:membrane dipeptidase
MTSRPGSIDGFLDELAHVRRVAGLDAVGVGSDMAGLSTSTSIPTYQAFAVVPAALLARGFAEPEVRQVLGGNFLRLFETVSARR